MAISQTTLHCKHCGGMTLHQKSVFGIGWGLLLTLVTGGFFIPFWILLAIVDSARPYHCLLCSVTPRGRPGPTRSGNPRHPPAAGGLRGPFPSAPPHAWPACHGRPLPPRLQPDLPLLSRVSSGHRPFLPGTAAHRSIRREQVPRPPARILDSLAKPRFRTMVPLRAKPLLRINDSRRQN